jgi:membrane peptidoglycan carboxypeptidase
MPNLFDLFGRVSDRLSAGGTQSASSLLAASLDLPKHLILLVLLTEDKRFASHSGLDLIAVTRALFAFFRRKGLLQGASTITQQLHAIHHGRTPRSLGMKLRRLRWALRHERRHSKREILATYFASAYWGRSFVGLRAASRGYFDTEPAKLTACQSFFLAERLARPNSVNVRRIVYLVRRAPVQNVIESTDYDSLIEIYERTFGVGRDLQWELAKSTKRSDMLTSKSSAAAWNAPFDLSSDTVTSTHPPTN